MSISRLLVLLKTDLKNDGRNTVNLVLCKKNNTTYRYDWVGFIWHS